MQFNKTVDDFIHAFEDQFSIYLDPDQTIPPNGREAGRRKTKYFTVCLAEKKFSDWDLHCWVKDNVTAKTLKEMSQFVYSFPGLTCTGNMLTVSTNHSELFHHINNAPYLQFMGLMPQEKYAPFIDIHIQPPKNRQPLISEAIPQPLDDQFIDWLLITYWRKLLNKDYDRASRLGEYLAKIPEVEYDKIKLNISELEKRFRNNSYFDEVVAVLKTA